MKIYYATTNNAKVISLSSQLIHHNIIIEQIPFEIPEPRSDSVEYIAKQKVIYAYDLLKEPVIALDAGFWITALNGFPKAHVNFALETVGIDGILKLMESRTDRSCEFQHSLAYLDQELNEPITFDSPAKGLLTKERRGKMQSFVWSELGLIFNPLDRSETLGEMTQEDYQAWRGTMTGNHYAVKFGQWLKEHRL